MKLNFLIIFMLAIFSISALANTEFLEWGYGTKLIGVSNTRNIWGSSFDSDINGTEKNIMISSIGLPMIADFDNDGLNEIVIWNRNSIYLLDNNGDVQSIITPPLNGILGRGSAYKSDLFNTGLIAYLTNNSGNMSVNIINFTQNSFYVADSYDVPDLSYRGDVYVGKTADYAVIPINKTWNFTLLNLINDTIEVIQPTIKTNMKTGVPDDYTIETDCMMTDIDNDGNDEFIFIGNASGGTQMNSYDTSRKLYDFSNIQVNTASSGTSNLMFMGLGAGSLGVSSDNYIFSVMDDSGLLYLSVFAPTGARVLSQRSTSVIPQIIVSDVENDGKNELCAYLGNSSSSLYLNCWDELFKYKYKFNNSGLGEDVGTRAFLISSSPNRLYAGNGTYNIEISKNITLIRKFELPPASSYPYTAVFPVMIQDRTNYVNDLFFYSKESAKIQFSRQEAVLCGNGICDTGETSFTCFADCPIVSPTQAVLTEVTISPCDTLVWRTNTTIIVTAKAESSDSARVQTKIVSYNYDSNWSTLISSGGTQTFSFIANQSGSNLPLIVYARTETNTQESSLTYSYDVNDAFGSGFGESSCSTIQPLEEVLANVNQTIDEENNAIINTLTGINIFLKIGFPALWIISMIIVSIAILWICHALSFPAMLVSGFVIFFNGLMLILGAMMQILNVGIVIGIIVFGVIAIVVSLAKRVTQ